VSEVKALRILYAVFVLAQLYWLVRIFFWRPNIEDSYHYSIAIAGYALFGFFASIAVLLLAITTKRLIRPSKATFVAMGVAIPSWGLLFLLASVAV
jgi:hypothetical protein